MAVSTRMLHFLTPESHPHGRTVSTKKSSQWSFDTVESDSNDNERSDSDKSSSCLSIDHQCRRWNGSSVSRYDPSIDQPISMSFFRSNQSSRNHFRSFTSSHTNQTRWSHRVSTQLVSERCCISLQPHSPTSSLSPLNDSFDSQCQTKPYERALTRLRLADAKHPSFNALLVELYSNFNQRQYSLNDRPSSSIVFQF